MGRGAFQELDAITLLRPHCKLAIQPRTVGQLSRAIQDAYDAPTGGQAGTAFIDIPADIIKAHSNAVLSLESRTKRHNLPLSTMGRHAYLKAAKVLKEARAPLVVIGKGAAYVRAEEIIRNFVNETSLPFLPSPMGKGVIRDSHPLNCASARSAAISNADVVLVLCARLNWMFHFGEPPKWNSNARFIILDLSVGISYEKDDDKELKIACDIKQGLPELLDCLSGWKYGLASSTFAKQLSIAKAKNERKAEESAQKATMPLSLAHAFSVIRSSLHSLSPPSEGGIVYVSEGANSMDVSRSVFPVEYPRLRLDAGTNAAMGVGMGYAIAAYEAYNGDAAEAVSGLARRKKIVALEGDSAFGFSAMELETMARYQMDVLVFVMNNGGVYHGDADSANEWLKKKANTLKEPSAAVAAGDRLRSTSLGWEVGYEKIAEACGGKGCLVRTAEELRNATIEGYKATVPFVVNVIIESGKKNEMVSLGLVLPTPICIANADILPFRTLDGRPVGRRMMKQAATPSYDFILYFFQVGFVMY